MAFVTLAASLTGCHPFSSASKPPSPLSTDAAQQTPAATPDKLPHPGLASDEWVRTIPQPGTATPREHRWHNPRLAELLAMPAAHRPDLTAALKSPQPVVAANAAIVLARWHNNSAREPLAEAVRSTPLSIRLRSAAAEAVADLPEPTPLLRELLSEYGRCGPEELATYLPELHAELLHALVRHAETADDARFIAALASPTPDVRLAALSAWSKPGQSELPEAAADLRSDPEARVRAAAQRAIAARPCSDAVEYAIAGVSDYTLEVRLAAIAGLGKLGGDAAREKLESLLKADGESDRAAAVAALGRLGADEPLRRATADKSWLVRAAVADALADLPTRRTLGHDDIALAEELLADRSIDVQKRAIAALDGWPLNQAGPLLLAAMDEGPFLRRKAAASQLAQRWPVAREYPADAPAERRAVALEKLKQAWSAEQPRVDPAVIPASHVAEPPAASQATLDQVAALVKTLGDARSPAEARAAERELREMGDSLPASLETLVQQRNLALPEELYRSVLGGLGGEFATLELLAASDVTSRRRGAEQLKQRAADTPLRPLVAMRLADLGSREADPLVMRSLLAAVARDGSEPAARLAYAAVSHPDDEIRRLGCEHLATHPSADHEPLLRPALADDNTLVVTAAVRALGHKGLVTDPMPLEQLLAHADRGVRLEAAVALVRIGSPAGPPALERLAQDIDARVRRRAAQAMGELADPTFTATLISLLGQGEGVGVAALTSLPRVVGRDMPADETGDKVRAWKKWWTSTSHEPSGT